VERFSAGDAQRDFAGFRYQTALITGCDLIDARPRNNTIERFFGGGRCDARHESTVHTKTNADDFRVHECFPYNQRSERRKLQYVWPDVLQDAPNHTERSTADPPFAKTTPASNRERAAISNSSQSPTRNRFESH